MINTYIRIYNIEVFTSNTFLHLKCEYFEWMQKKEEKKKSEKQIDVIKCDMKTNCVYINDKGDRVIQKFRIKAVDSR